jgi:NTP pyrophosphatase (non-canonical NTP hydrolase)
MSSLKDLQKRVAEFVETRNWRQFHNDPKGTLLALGGEVGELMELYRFTTEKEAQDRTTQRKEEVEDELGDILYILLMFCEENDIDLEQAFKNKEKKREAKYPVKKFKGVNAKYTDV